MVPTGLATSYGPRTPYHQDPAAFPGMVLSGSGTPGRTDWGVSTLGFRRAERLARPSPLPRRKATSWDGPDARQKPS